MCVCHYLYTCAHTHAHTRTHTHIHTHTHTLSFSYTYITSFVAFHALLSLTALEEIEGDDPDEICNQQVMTHDTVMSFDIVLSPQNTNIPGYRSVPLMQALNGYPLEQRGTGMPYFFIKRI